MSYGLDEPRTIEELRAWFKENGYEPAKTRFFVGVDVRAPKAFGVYRDELGEFIVYKNKADGTRVIRYQGDDEAFAVHELYDRFQQEILNQQTRWNADNMQSGAPAFDAFDYYERERQRKERGKKLPVIIALVFLSFIITLKFVTRMQTELHKDFGLTKVLAPFFVMMFVMIFSNAWLNGMNVLDYFRSIPKKTKKTLITVSAIYLAIFGLISINVQQNGYYSINNDLYYRAGTDWYHYDDYAHDWKHSYSVPSQLTSSSWRDYNNTESHQGYYDSFEYTSYYEDWKGDQRNYSEGRDYNSSHDHDSWSSNDWNSGYTDWNSDW
ncbi:MAG: hypothetical protein J6I66_05740 [Lachnospiraceae bacterium]|nr:hypothetical protein [Lachnospiraceae bacterium]